MNIILYKSKTLCGKTVRGIYNGDLSSCYINLKEKELFLLKYVTFRGIPLRKIKESQIKPLCKDLMIFYKSGFTIKNTLLLLNTQYKSKILKTALQQVVNNIDKGLSLSQAFSQTYYVFPKLFISSIMIGEESGKMESIINNLGIYYEKKLAFKNKTKQMLVYPTIVSIFTLFLVIYLILVLIPRFYMLYEDLSIEIPPIVKILFLISSSAREYSYYFNIFIPAILLYIAYNIVKSKASTRFVYKMPIIKDFLFDIFNIHLLEGLHTMIASGINLVKALEIFMESNRNSYYSTDMEMICDSIREGESITNSFRKVGIFDECFLSMIYMGETSGNLETMLYTLKEMRQDEYYKKINIIMNLIQPVLMIFLGLVILVVMYIFFIPLTNALAGFN